MSEVSATREELLEALRDIQSRLDELDAQEAFERDDQPTEEALSQEVLPEEALSLRSAIDVVPALVWTTDRELRLTSLGGAGVMQLPGPDRPRVGQTLEEYFGTDDPDYLAIQRHRQTIRQGTSTSYELPWLGRNFQAYLEPVRDEQGHVLGVAGIAFDITDWKQFEEALRQSEERLRLVFNQQFQFMAILAPDGKVLTVNDLPLKTLGVAREDILGKLFWEMPAWENQPDWQESIRSHVMEAIESETPIESEDEYEVAGGTRYASSAYTAIRNEDGEVRYVIVQGVDITLRKQAERSLIESEAKFRALVEHSYDVISMFSPSGEILYASPSIQHVFGYSPSEAARLTALQLIHPDDLRDDEFQLFMGQPGATFRATKRVRHKNGEYRDVEIAATNLLEQTGIAAIVANCRDVTDRVRAEEARRTNEVERRRAESELAEAQAILRAAIEASPAGILVADAPDGRIRTVNSAALGMRDLPADQLVDIPLELHPSRWKCSHPDGTPYQPEDLPLSRAVLKGEVSRNVDVVIERNDGVKQWVLGNAAPVRNADGEIVAGVVVFPDITDQRRAEETYRKMESEIAHVARVSTMGEMVGGIAHELNQPLYAIQNYAKACGNLLDAEQVDVELMREWLERIGSTAEYAGDILQRLRNFVHRVPMKTEAVSLSDVVDAAVALTEYESRRLGLRVDYQAEESIPLVNIDAVQIQQVLVNLLRNAFEATQRRPGDQEVEPEVLIRASVVGEMVEVSVVDNGSGLDDELRIFDAFHSTKPKGLGLGLAVGRTIIEAHGGTLTGANREAAGAEFRLTIPIFRESVLEPIPG